MKYASIATIAAAAVEWLLLEIVRSPYHPPDDMTTLLGQEKYAIFVFMALIAVGWILFVPIAGLFSSPTRRSVTAFVAFLSVLALIFGTIVLYPPWPVSPPEMIFR